MIHTVCIVGLTNDIKIGMPSLLCSSIELLNNKLHGLSPPGGFVSPSGGFSLLLFDQAIPKNSQCHLADRNTICILHRSDCAWLCCLLSQCNTVVVLFFFLAQLKKRSHGALLLRQLPKVAP